MTRLLHPNQAASRLVSLNVRQTSTAQRLHAASATQNRSVEVIDVVPSRAPGEFSAATTAGFQNDERVDVRSSRGSSPFALALGRATPLSPSQLGSKECQESSVDPLLQRRAEAVRSAFVDFKTRVLDQLGGR